MSAGALTEMRSRLIAGLKRYFHAKRMEGLLSVQVGEGWQGYVTEAARRLLPWLVSWASRCAGQGAHLVPSWPLYAAGFLPLRLLQNPSRPSPSFNRTLGLAATPVCCASRKKTASNPYP